MGIEMEDFGYWIEQYVKSQKNRIETFHLGNRAWGDVTPIIHRIKQDLWDKAAFYFGTDKQKEEKINIALKKIEDYYNS